MSVADSQRGLRYVALLSLLVTAGSGPDSLALAGMRAASTETSPPCRVTIELQVESPFVPDGRQSLAEISFRVLFPSVTFEFDPKEDPLLGRCQVNSDKGKGTFSKLVLNDVQKGEERLSPRFLSPRPKEFSAGLAVESEPMAEDEAAAQARTAPEKVRLSFWTEWESMAVHWGSDFGIASLPEFKTVFEVPFRYLVQGKTFSATLPYEGRYPEDKGKWTIEIRPTAARPRSQEPAGALLLGDMRRLAQAPTLTIELIQDTLEVAFKKDEAASHEMVTFFVGTPRAGSRFEGFIRLVDCRVPTQQNESLLEPFVVVELWEAAAGQPTDAGRQTKPLLASEVVAGFGQPDVFQPEIPENPNSSASYIYKMGSRSLWLSLGRQPPEEVLRISIHPLEDVR